MRVFARAEEAVAVSFRVAEDPEVIPWLPPTIAFFPLRMEKSLSAGATPLTTTNRSC